MGRSVWLHPASRLWRRRRVWVVLGRESSTHGGHTGPKSHINNALKQQDLLYVLNIL